MLLGSVALLLLAQWLLLGGRWSARLAAHTSRLWSASTGHPGDCWACWPRGRQTPRLRRAPRPCGARAEDLGAWSSEFAYAGGTVLRPWDQFTGRWDAISRRLEEAFGSGPRGQPFRLVDLGSNRGFFSLQAARRHPNAEVIGVEGSAGVGNGKVGPDGGAPAIVETEAVRTHLDWASRLGLRNCLVAPEVWDYARVRELTASGRRLCDATLLLSVLHHVHRLSHGQYPLEDAQGSDGFVHLLAEILKLASLHFVELPGPRDLRSAYKAHGSQEAMLEAACSASGRRWRLAGPLHTAKWFGQRELWELRDESLERLPLWPREDAFPRLEHPPAVAPPLPQRQTARNKRQRRRGRKGQLHSQTRIR